MRMFGLIFIFYFVSSICALQNNNKLLVISFDGFRYDYINRKITPNINGLKSQSTSAKFLVNIFPTQTFPNHFSIATGLYSENHGVLQSEIYDTQQKKVVGYSYDLWHYNEKVLPIWTLNEKSGGTSGVMMWPGSDYDFAGINTTYLQKFDPSIKWEDRVTQVISWFNNKSNPANLVMVYFDQPDAIAHAYGPESKQVNDQIKKVDNIVKYIFDQLKANNLVDLNVIILSDHGMEGVTKDHIIDLRPEVGNICKMIGTSPVLQIFPNEGKLDEVYNKLKTFASKNGHFKVYKREDIPDEFHYKNCKRTPPIMALADLKYAFQDLFAGIQWYKDHYNDVTDKNTFGVHGYDPRTNQMHPYFIANGPLFKKNYEADHLYTVDMYLLFCEILKLRPELFDGDRARVTQIFSKSLRKKRSVTGAA